jgi:hypothetical protein
MHMEACSLLLRMLSRNTSDEFPDMGCLVFAKLVILYIWDYVLIYIYFLRARKYEGNSYVIL